MAITRRWQAGAEVDTTNSLIMEFSGSVAPFAPSNTEKKSGAYSYRWYFENRYAYVTVAATRQVRLGMHCRLGQSTTANSVLCRITPAALATQLIEVRATQNTTGLRLYVAGVEQDLDISLYTEAAWFHFGLDIKIDNAAGWAKVYIDGVEQLSFVGNTGNVDIENVIIGNYGGTDWPQYNYLDDIYIDDTAGEGAAAVVPDLRFEFISPDGVGNYSAWDPSPGGGEANWEDVDERPNDGDTTHVEAQALNERDSYTMTTYAMAAGWAIEAVIPTTIAKKTDGGTDTEINLMTRQGGVDDDGADQDLPTSYGLLWERFPLDPGGGPWSQADLDSVECGYRGRGAF